MAVDFMVNGQSSNPTVLDKLMAANWDPGVLRPWVGNDGKSYMTINQGGVPTTIRANTNATLTKDAWLQLDTAVAKVARSRLRAVADLRAAGLTFNIPNGMGTSVLQYQRMNDTGNAIISMDPIRTASDFRPVFDSVYLPLPFIHSDFQLGARELAVSRQSGAPLDTTKGEMAARRVAEETEKLTLGRLDTYTYAGGTIYGLCNFTGRLTANITKPTHTAWTPKTHLTEMLACRQALQNAKHYGDYIVYYSSAWDTYLDDDFSSSYPNKTLRQRLREIDGFTEIKTLDYLDTPTSTYNVVILEKDSGTIRLVIGMDVTTLEWEEMGGLQKNYKVMCIIIPQLRADMDGNTGILHATAV